MTRFLPFIAILLASCASPRYSYYFDHYTTTVGTDATPFVENKSRNSPLILEPHQLSASAGPETPAIARSQEKLQKQTRYDLKTQRRRHASNEQVKQGRKQIIQAVKQFRKELRATNGLSKSSSKSTSPLNDQATQKLDNEVIVAIALGAVGITLSLLGGVSAGFWIAGVLCLGVGVYFFVDWLSKR
jgi:hypothetical protein